MARPRSKPAPAELESGGSFKKSPFIRVSPEIHDRLKVMSALEHKPMGTLIDEMLGEQLDAYFARRGIKLGTR